MSDHLVRQSHSWCFRMIGRIFFEFKRFKDRYSHGFSLWFGKWKKSCGIQATPRMKVFHSFRHTVTSILGENDVPEQSRLELLEIKVRLKLFPLSNRINSHSTAQMVYCCVTDNQQHRYRNPYGPASTSIYRNPDAPKIVAAIRHSYKLQFFGVGNFYLRDIRKALLIFNQGYQVE